MPIVTVKLPVASPGKLIENSGVLDETVLLSSKLNGLTPCVSTLLTLIKTVFSTELKYLSPLKLTV